MELLLRFSVSEYVLSIPGEGEARKCFSSRGRCWFLRTSLLGWFSLFWVNPIFLEIRDENAVAGALIESEESSSSIVICKFHMCFFHPEVGK